MLLQRDRVVVEAVEHYLSLAHRIQREELPNGTAWRDVEAYREKLVANKEYSWINFREQKVRYIGKVHHEQHQGDFLSKGTYTRCVNAC